tara:strand:- start:1283 stop:1732 length:450 start_codon:yes stop_codon:yes gene_type:complete
MKNLDSLGRSRHPNQGAGRNGLPSDGQGAEKLVCPDWLGSIGKEEWKRALDELSERGILSSKDAPALELYAAAFEEYRWARADVIKNGIRMVTKTERGHEVERKNPATSVMNSAWTRCRTLLHELGLTPRSDVKGADDSDEFDQLMGLC